MASPAITELIEEPQRPITFAEYRALPDDGLRYELINGELCMSPAPRLLHQYVIGEFFAAINDHVRRHRLGLAMFAPYDVKLTGHTAVQPDLLFFGTANQRAIGNDYATGAPDLAIDVLSPSNRRVDLVLKWAIYADNGVREYWIADPDKRTIRVNLLHDGHHVETTHTDGMGEFATLPGLAIEMAKLFDMPEWLLAGNDDNEDEDGE